MTALEWLRRRWDVEIDAAQSLPFARVRTLLNLKRLELLGIIALATELCEAGMNLGFGLAAYYWVIGSNIVVYLGVIALARATLARGGPLAQDLVPPATVAIMLLVAQSSIAALAAMWRFANVYPLYVLLAAVLFVLPPRLLAVILAGTLATYVDMVLAAPIPPIDQLSAIRTAAISCIVSTVAGALIHAARERDHAQKRVIDERNALLRQRNAAMDEVMAFAAHDLRSPLMGLRNLIDFVLPRAAADPALGLRTLEETSRSLTGTLTLIGRLLAAHEAEYGPVHIVEGGDLRFALMAAAERSRPLAMAKGVALAPLLPNRPVPARADPAVLERILDNLVANAVRFAPAGSAVLLRCRREEACAVLSVADEGPGIPEADRAHLFGKFRRGAAHGSGSGLGLFIVGTLAERLGGAASYRPNAPQGSVFEVRVPDQPPGD